MTVITSSGTKTTLSVQEMNYLRSFLLAGDRGGFYMALQFWGHNSGDTTILGTQY